MYFYALFKESYQPNFVPVGKLYVFSALVNRLEKSTPPPVVAVVTNIRYAPYVMTEFADNSNHVERLQRRELQITKYLYLSNRLLTGRF